MAAKYLEENIDLFSKEIGYAKPRTKDTLEHEQRTFGYFRCI